MSENDELFDDLDSYLTAERVGREGGPYARAALIAHFAESRLHELGSFVSPGLYFMYLKIFEEALKEGRPALPDRVYQKAKRALDGALMLWDASGMEPAARHVLSTRREEYDVQIKEELAVFLRERGFDDGRRAG